MQNEKTILVNEIIANKQLNFSEADRQGLMSKEINILRKLLPAGAGEVPMPTNHEPPKQNDDSGDDKSGTGCNEEVMPTNFTNQK